MQIQVSKLREAMKLLEPVVPSGRRVTLEILRNVLLKDGKAAADNLEVFALVDLPEVDSECLIPHKAVLELLRYIPGNQMLTIEPNKKVITFSWDGGKSSYPRADIKDYPPVPEFTSASEAKIDGDALIPVLDSARDYCAAADDKRPILQGVTIFPGEKLDVAAGDGFRMAYQTVPASLPIEKPIIIPQGAVSILSSIWRHTTPAVTQSDSLVGLITQKREAHFALGYTKGTTPDKLRVTFNNVTVLIQLLEGTPPNFKQLIPSETPTTVRFFPAELERAAKRIKKIALDAKTGIVRLVWTTDTMTVSAKSEDLGEVEGTIPVQADNPGKIGLNIMYLLEYLKGKDGIVTMGITGQMSPIVMRYRQSPLVLIMPMMVQW